MVGEGINDVPAIAVAGTDTAPETAEIALMGDFLSRMMYLLDLNRLGENVIQQNIYVSIIVKLVLAVGVIPGWVNLITTVLVGDVGVAFGVTANAIRLRNISDNQQWSKPEN